MRSEAILYIQNKDKYGFLWNILAHLHPCSSDNPERTSSFVELFKELNIGRFDFTDGFKTSFVNRFEIINELSIKIFELKFLFGR